jgi:hypothetical protein
VTPFEKAQVLRERMILVRARAEACRLELERQDRALKIHSRPKTRAKIPLWLAVVPYAALFLGGLSFFQRPAQPSSSPVVLYRAAEPEEDPGIRNALALVYDYPDPATGAPMLEVAGMEGRPGVSNWDVERLDGALYKVSFGPAAGGRTYRFEVDLGDASVRPMTADSIFAASSLSF